MTAFILKQLKKDQKGFTLIELLAVIVILGVIAAIAVPLIGGVISKSKTDSDIATASQIYQASRMYITTEMDGVVDTLDIKLSDLTTGKYLTALSLPSTKKALIEGTTIVKYTTGVLTNVVMVTDDGTYTCASADVIASKGSCIKS